MRRAEALAGGGDRVERVAGDLEAVLGHRRIEADVAVAAAFCFLSEVGEQHAAAALRRLAVGDEGVETLVLAALVLGLALFLLDEVAALTEVVEAIEHEGLGGARSEEHTSELQSLMRISYAISCFNKKTIKIEITTSDQ